MEAVLDAAGSRRAVLFRRFRGPRLRSGIHTGECEVQGDDLSGLAVHIGARFSALGQPGEIVVSSTVKELVVGSNMQFTDCGEHELKGVPGSWRLHALGEECRAQTGGLPICDPQAYEQDLMPTDSDYILTGRAVTRKTEQLEVNQHGTHQMGASSRAAVDSAGDEPAI